MYPEVSCSEIMYAETLQQEERLTLTAEPLRSTGANDAAHAVAAAVLLHDARRIYVLTCFNFVT